MDEISTGLDAAATFDITSALRRWTRLMNGSAVVALLQPAPEVYDMFDDIILLREVSLYSIPIDSIDADDVYVMCSCSCHCDCDCDSHSHSSFVVGLCDVSWSS